MFVFFVILVMHHKSYIETTDRHDFSGKPSKWRRGRVLSWKIPEFYSVYGARSTKQHFFAFLRHPSTILRTAYRKVLPQTNGTDGKPRLKVCLLLVWRVCDQAFGRYRQLKGAEKWSCNHHENGKFTFRHT